MQVSHPDPDSCQTVLALTGRAAFRTALPRVSSWCDAKGRDSLLEFHAHRLRCMHAWGAARARHSRVSLQTSILRTIQDLLRSAQGFEMRVLPPNHSFSKAENRVTSTPANMHPSDRTQDKQAACAVALSLPDTLADCAPPRARPHHRFSTAEFRCNQLCTPTCVQASV